MLIMTPRRIGATIKNAARLRIIVGVLAKNGFHNLAERLQLARVGIWRRWMSSSAKRTEPLNEQGVGDSGDDFKTTAERLRLSFEELGPTFIKFGQLLATRPDLVPEDWVEEFKRLHDQVSGVTFDHIRPVLERHFGGDIQRVFQSIDPIPLAAASIAQVHRAVLKDGTPVVVKIQRPGVAELIRDDVRVLYFLAELLQKYVPEIRLYNPVGVVDEFFRTLELETDFIVEANNIRRFRENFRDDPTVYIPHVYLELTGKKVLVLEALNGVPLSQSKRAFDQEGIDRSEVVKRGLRCYLKMVFRDGFFHGDLHAGNLFILPDSKIGLIDFGIVGRLNQKTKDSIANMFIALYEEDYDRLADEYVALAPYNEQVDVDRLARDLQNLLSPYFGLSMKNINLGRILLRSTEVAARHRLVLPSELMLFFKSVVTIEGMARLVVEDFDFLPYALEFSTELAKIQYDPERVWEEVIHLARDSAGMLYAFPRQFRQLVRRLNHPESALRVRVDELHEIKRAIETSSNIIFLGVIIGSLILGGAITSFIPHGPYIFQMPTIPFIMFVFATFLGLAAFRNYIKK